MRLVKFGLFCPFPSSFSSASQKVKTTVAPSPPLLHPSLTHPTLPYPLPHLIDLPSFLIDQSSYLSNLLQPNHYLLFNYCYFFLYAQFVGDI